MLISFSSEEMFNIFLHLHHLMLRHFDGMSFGSERSHSRLRAFRACSDCSERLFTNARDNDQSQLTNGYLTPASARRYPNYFLNAPCMVLSDLLGNNIASAPLNASAVHSVGVFIDTQCDSQIIHQLWIQTSSALAFSYLCSWELHMQNLTKFTI